MNASALQNTVELLVDQIEAVGNMPTPKFEPSPSLGLIVAKCAANDDGSPPNAPAANDTGIVDTDEEIAFSATSKRLTATLMLSKVEGCWVVGHRIRMQGGKYPSIEMQPSRHSVRFPTRKGALEFGLGQVAKHIEACHGGMAAMPSSIKKDFAQLISWSHTLIKGKRSDAKPLENKTFIDIFAGIGGFHIALKKLGARCVAAVELDPAARATYQANHGADFPFYKDIKDVDASALPKSDILTVGLPCPAFSIAGNQAGFASESGSLLFEVVRVINVLKPALIILENVNAFASHDKGKTADKAIDLIARAGYAVSMQVMDAAMFGTPQQRERVFIVAHRLDLISAANDLFMFPEGTDDSRTVADILEKGIKADRCEAAMVKHFIGSADPSRRNLAGLIDGKNMQGYRVYSPKGKGITLCANSGGPGRQTGLYLVDGKPRRLTPRECARMQGFPDSFIPNASSNQARKQFGNAVAVPLVAEIAKAAARFF